MKIVSFSRDRTQTNAQYRKEKAMRKHLYLFALTSVLLPVGIVSAQESYPVMERVTQKIIQYYQTAYY